MVSFHYEDLAAGTYTARLRYTVGRDIEALNANGNFDRPDAATLARAKTLWQGSAVSDWITFTVANGPRNQD